MKKITYWKLVFNNFFSTIEENELMALGGQVTYYIILSFFPLLIFLLTLATYTPITSSEILENLSYLLPAETYEMVTSILYEIMNARSPTLLSFSMFGTLWAALNGINALMRGISKAYGLKISRSFFRLKLTAVFFLLFIFLAILLSFIIIVGGEIIGLYLFNLLGVKSLFLVFWQKLRLLIQFSFLIVTFQILNHMATFYSFSHTEVLPGSLFSALGWIIISLAFSSYVNHFNTFSLTYGSIGGIIILLLWLYWSSETLLLGCALNSALIKTKSQKTNSN